MTSEPRQIRPNLAKYPRVSSELTAPNAFEAAVPPPDIWPHVHKMLKAFGPERLLSAADLTRLRIGRGNTEINGPKSKWGGLLARRGSG